MDEKKYISPDRLKTFLDTLIENGQIGSDVTKTIVNDRSIEPTDYFDNGYTYIKVSDEPVDLNIVQSVTATFLGETNVLSKEEFTLNGEEGVVQFFTIPGVGSDECFWIVSLFVDMGENVTRGLYFQWHDNSEDSDPPTGILDLTYNTLTKIDPKYYDRLAWSDYELTEVLPETTVSATEDIPGIDAEGAIGLVEGDTYVVNWNGTEYTTKCVVVTNEGVGDIAVIGNYSMMNMGDDTGEPFAILELIGGGMYAIMTNVVPSENTVSIKNLKETIHKVDPKYLYTPDMDAKSGEEGYIANRPMYRTSETVELFKDVSVTEPGDGPAVVEIDGIIDTDKKAAVTFDGKEYLCDIIRAIDGYSTIDGNKYLYRIGDPECIVFPFVISWYDGYAPGSHAYAIGFPDGGPHTVSLSVEVITDHYIDKNYLKISPTVLSWDLSENLIPGDSYHGKIDELIEATEKLSIGGKVYATIDGIDVEVYDIMGSVESSLTTIRCRSEIYDYIVEPGNNPDISPTTITKTLRHPQADYAQNDSTQPDYVKNRLAWTEDSREIVLEEQEVTLVYNEIECNYEVEIPGERSIAENEELTIVFDGVEYRLTTVDSGVSYACGSMAGQEAPFTLGYMYSDPDNYRMFITGNSNVSGTHTVSVTKGELTIHQIDPIYLPSGLATESYVEDEINALAENRQIGGPAYKTITINAAENIGNIPFDKDLVGLKVVDKRHNRYKPRDVLNRPSVDTNLVIAEKSFVGIYYNNAAGKLDKRILIITSDADNDLGRRMGLSVFFPYVLTGGIYEGANTLCYVYDDTSDTMGMGITLTRGWYALNDETYTYNKINLTETPFYYVADDKTIITEPDYFNYAFPACEHITYVVESGNIVRYSDDTEIVSPYKNACIGKLDYGDDGESPDWFIRLMIMSFERNYGTTLDYSSTSGINTDIIYEDGIHTIDPKYYERIAWTDSDVLGETIFSEEALAVTNGSFISGLLGIKEGQEYIVNWNGTEYRCTARSATIGTDTGIFIGNYYFFTQDTADNTGEEFLLGDVITNDVHAFMTSSGDGIYAVSISEFFSEVVHGVDPKYLPTGGVGYTSTELGYIFPETTITVSDNMFMWAGLLGLEEGKTYVVTWDGVEYNGKCVAVEADVTMYVIGNVALAEGTGDTGEPFVILDVPTEGIYGIMPIAGAGTYTVGIKGLKEIVHGVDPKYLPEGGFGWTETSDKIVVLESQTADFAYAEGTEEPYYNFETLSPIIVGDELVVVYDSTEYNVVVKEVEGIAGFGNMSVFGLEDNDEPFYAAYIPSNGLGMTLMSSDDVGTHTVEIYKLAKEVVHKIDPKYISEGGYGYESLKTLTFDGAGEIITDFGTPMSKVSDEVIDLNSVSLLRASSSDGSSYTFTKNMLICKTETVIGAIELGMLANAEDTNFEAPIMVTVSIPNYDSSMTAITITPGTYVLNLIEDSTYTYISQVKYFGVNTIDPKYLPAGGFGYMTEGVVFLTSELGDFTYCTTELDGTGIYYGSEYCDGPVSEGDELNVYWPGESITEYTVQYVDDKLCFGNLSLISSDAEDSGVSFACVYTEEDGNYKYTFYTKDYREDGVEFVITKISEVIRKIDSKFLPDTLATKEFVEEQNYIDENELESQINSLAANGRIGRTVYTTVEYEETGITATVEGVYTMVKVSGDTSYDLSKMSTIHHYDDTAVYVDVFSDAHVGFETVTSAQIITIDNIPYVIRVNGANDFGLDSGLWFLNYEKLRVDSITFKTVYKINEDYVPDTVATKTDLEEAIDDLISNGQIGYTDEEEVVHTIDPKYLPGLTLPVVELSEETAMAALGTGSATVTAEEAAIFDEMAQNGSPFILNVTVQGVGTTSCFCQCGKDAEGASYSGALFGQNRTDGVIVGISIQMFQLFETGNGWDVVYITRSI